MQVSRSGFYAWLARPQSTRSLQDQSLSALVLKAHQAGRQVYGSPRVMKQLRHWGVRIGRHRVARLMRQARLQGRSNHLFVRKAPYLKFFQQVPNRIRELSVTGINQVWHGDVTYLKVAGAWRYLAVIIDQFSRRVVGWSMANHRTSRLTIDALQHAIRNRRPPAGLHFHSDRGIEFSALEFKAKLRQHGIHQSMNRASHINDNAYIESFFHSLKIEGLFRMTFHADQHLRDEVLSYIQFYNQDRLHSSIGYLPPATFEKQHLTLARVH